MKDRIKEIRKDNKLTQQSLADILDVSLTYIGYIETGQRIPSKKVISKLATQFGLNENWIVSGTGEKYAKMSRAETIANISTQLMDDNDPFRIALVDVLCKMTPQQMQVFEDVFYKVVKELPIKEESSVENTDNEEQSV